jgi:hypothetical protein
MPHDRGSLMVFRLLVRRPTSVAWSKVDRALVEDVIHVRVDLPVALSADLEVGDLVSWLQRGLLEVSVRIQYREAIQRIAGIGEL